MLMERVPADILTHTHTHAALPSGPVLDPPPTVKQQCSEVFIDETAVVFTDLSFPSFCVLPQDDWQTPEQKKGRPQEELFKTLSWMSRNICFCHAASIWRSKCKTKRGGPYNLVWILKWICHALVTRYRNLRYLRVDWPLGCYRFK